MLGFISEENYEIHKGYLKSQKLKLSIFEKYANISDILRQKMSADKKEEIIDLHFSVLLHDVFFNSFIPETFVSSPFVTEKFGSEAAFLNHVFRECMNTPVGFVCIFNIGGVIKTVRSSEKYTLMRYGTPTLAVDVSEHAYFLDYAFDKERYLRAALPHFNLSKIS